MFKTQCHVRDLSDQIIYFFTSFKIFLAFCPNSPERLEPGGLALWLVRLVGFAEILACGLNDFMQQRQLSFVIT